MIGTGCTDIGFMTCGGDMAAGEAKFAGHRLNVCDCESEIEDGVAAVEGDGEEEG